MLDNWYIIIYNHNIPINEVLNLKEDYKMKNYICWEIGFECYNEIEIVEVYEKEILKSEYPTFDGWLDDMLKMGILIEGRVDNED